VLKGGVGREDSVVGLDDTVAHPRSCETHRGSIQTFDTASRRRKRTRVNSKLELALLAVVGAQPLEEESAETGTSATAERVEEEEALQ
jgi:hypothetical protein